MQFSLAFVSYQSRISGANLHCGLHCRHCLGARREGRAVCRCRMSIFVISKALVETVISAGAAFNNLQGSCSYAGDEAKRTDDNLQHHFGCFKFDETLERLPNKDSLMAIARRIYITCYIKPCRSPENTNPAKPST